MLLWVLLAGLVVALILTWALGANDVANTFGTSVGSGVLSIRQAIVIAAIFEFTGAVLLGSNVSDTLRRELIDPDDYEDEPETLMIGMLAASIGAATWLVSATALALPVSGTHSTVGAIVGFALVAQGPSGVDWFKLGMIAVSWISSPVLSGALSAVLYFLTRLAVLKRAQSLKWGLRALPLYYGGTCLVLTFFVVYKGTPGLDVTKYIPLWGVLLLAVGVGLIVALFVATAGTYLMKLWLKWKYGRDALEPGFSVFNAEEKWVTEHASSPDEYSRETTVVVEGTFADNYGVAPKEGYDKLFADDTNESDAPSVDDSSIDPEADVSELSYGAHTTESNRTTEDNSNHDEFGEVDEALSTMHANSKQFDEKTESLFALLQVFIACFAAFAHGANDIANSIAPFIAIWVIYDTDSADQSPDSPIWILVIGGVAIIVGLATWGYKVMQTVGRDLTLMTPSRGSIILLSTATTVLAASGIGIPISSTHCLVGGVVGVGLVEGTSAVNFRLFLNIAISWVVTVPVTAVLTILLYLVLDVFQLYIVPNYYY